MGQGTIGHAVKVLYAITELDEHDLVIKDPWGDVADACDVSKDHVRKIPSRIGTEDEALSWPGSLTEKRYCDYANHRVCSVLRSHRPSVVCENLRVSLSGAKLGGASEGVESVLSAIERNDLDDYGDLGDEEKLFDLLFHTLYQEASEDMRRKSNERELARANRTRGGEKGGGSAGGPGSATIAASPFSPDVLAGMLAGDGGGVPPVPACLGMGGEALLVRLLPRELYQAHAHELPALAAGRAPAASAALARELAADDGAWLRDLGARARTLAGTPGTAAPALLGCVGRAFALLEDAEPPLAAPAVLQRDRELVDRFVDGDPARALAALAVLAATGPYGALVALSSPGAAPAVA